MDMLTYRLIFPRPVAHNSEADYVPINIAKMTRLLLDSIIY